MLLLARQTNQLQRFTQALSYAVHPILVLVDTPSQIYDWLSENISSRSALLEENKKLNTESLLLKAKLQKLDVIEKENIRLHSLLESSFTLGEQFIAASLIRVKLDPFSHMVTADKGSRYKIYPGQAVLNADGVIGQVTKVLPLTASIILITDPNHAIPVEISRTGLRTIATGSGHANQLNLPYLPHNADIVKGDLLITSGLGGLYPRGYPVAHVSTLTPAVGQAFMYAQANTVAKIESSRELLLVWSQQQPIPLLPKNIEEPLAKPNKETNNAP